MNKLLIVAKHEYLSNLKSKGFLIASFGIPLFIIVLMFVVVQVAVSSEESTAINTVGYIDNADIIDLPDESGLFVPLETIEVAHAQLADHTIDAYLIIPDTYITEGQVELYAYENVPESFEDNLNRFLRENLAEGQSTNFPVDRLQADIDMSVYIQSTGRELTEETAIALFLTPTIFAMVFLLASQISSTFLISSLVEEKTNRIMEILLTSVTPLQLLLGKIIGLGSLGLTQMFIWIGVGIGIMTFGQDVPFLAGIVIPPDIILLNIVYFVLTYFLLASIMAGMSVIVSGEQESRQFAGIFVFPFILPFFFIAQIIEDPNGMIATGLTLFPFSAGMTVIMRSAFVTIPLEELVLSLTILSISCVVITWISAKVFRWATLLYGKQPSLREIWRVIRAKHVDVGTIITGEQTTS